MTYYDFTKTSTEQLRRSWKCCGCGAPSPDRKRSCDCATNCVHCDGESALKLDPSQPLDSRCYDLAETFLEDSPHLATAKRTAELAALIQTTIEDWLDHEQNNYEPPAWFRPRRVPPELAFMTAVLLIALGGWLAVAPPRPAAVASIAPACADAAQPCRGVR